MISFTVPGLPVAQPRQRHRIVAGAKPWVQNYTPKDSPVNAFKASVAMALAEAYQGPPLEGPVCLTVLFVMPRPKGMIWKKRPMPRVYHDKKPDKDNLTKSLQDALVGLAFRDDCQIAASWSEKVIAAGDEQSRSEVKIELLGEI